MNDATGLQALIAKRDAEMQSLDADKKTAEDVQKRIDSKSVRIRVLNEIISEMSPLGAASSQVATLKGLGKYSNCTTRDGILDILSQPGAGAMMPSQIAKRLQAEGAKSKSPNFSTIVYTECKRLAGLGKLKREDDGYRVTTAGMLDLL